MISTLFTCQRVIGTALNPLNCTTLTELPQGQEKHWKTEMEEWCNKEKITAKRIKSKNETDSKPRVLKSEERQYLTKKFWAWSSSDPGTSIIHIK